MRVRAAQIQSRVRRTTAFAALVAVVASVVVAVPVHARTPLAAAVAPVADPATSAPTYGPGRLRGATPMTRGCVDTRTRALQHRKKGQSCPAGSRSVDFQVADATPLCRMPDRAVKSFKDPEACWRRDGVFVRGLGNNRMLFCAVPGREVRWAPRGRRCVRPEKSWTLRNHRPVELTLAGATLAERSGRGAVAGTFNVVDVDPGDAHRFRLVPGAGATHNHLFRVRRGQLVARTDFDHETAASLRVRVRVRDFRHRRLVRSFTVAVTDVNEAPTGMTLDGRTVEENLPAGTEVGRLGATDPDHGEVLTYALVENGDHADFRVEGDRLLTASPLDHEEGATRTVRVEVTDRGGLATEEEFTVDVTDVNEAPTALTLTRDVVAENAAADTLVGRLEVVDVDAGPPYRFEILPGDDGALFALDGDALRTVGPLDHEEAEVRRVTVRVTDVDGLTLTRTLRVHVVDVNEAPTAPVLSNDTVSENEPVGTVVGTLTSSDPDDGDEPTLTLVAGVGDDDNAAFEVVDGELRARRSFNFEARSSYAVRVRASDGDLHTDATFTVTVVDVDEAPAALRLETDAVDENLAGPVSRLLADDEEGDDLTWSLVAGPGDTDNASFAITGDLLRTVTGLDHESGATRSIRVRVTDGTTPVVAVLTVTVTDVNEAPALLRLSGQAVDENTPGLVGTLSAQDPDDGDVLTYALVPGAGDDDNALFEVVDDELRLPSGLDFEAGGTRTVRVEARDRAGLAVQRTFTVTVRDLNEAPSQPALDATEVDENATDAVVGTLSSVDPDAGATFTFSLVTGTGDTDNDLFVVVGRELRVRGSLDFEAGATRSIRVQVSDGDLTATRHFVITVNDRNDAPTGLTLTPAEVAENAAAAVVGPLSAVDQDADPLTYALVAGAGDDDNAAFEVVGDELRTRAGLDFEAGATRSVRVAVSDGTAQVERRFTVTVLDVNEAPTGLDLSPRVVDENAAAARVGTLTASDPDAGASLTYALVPGAGDDDNAAFEVVGDELRTRAGLDFEAGATRSVRVAVSDGELAQQRQLTVTVRDRNDAPTAISLAPTRIRLDAEVGDVVGTLSAADQDAAPTHAFTDTSVAGTHSAAGYFTVDGDQVKVARSLDALATGIVELRVRVDDPWADDATQDASLERVLEIEVLSGRSIGLDPASISENNPAGTEVGTLTYVDPLATGPVTFALVPGVLDAADFEVAGEALVARTPFDHEATPVRRVRIRVTAGATTFTQDLEVAVADVDEAPTGLSLSGTSVPENAVAAPVGTLSAVDPEGRTLTYSLVGGTGDTHNAEFVVADNTLRTSLALDFEAGATRSVRVRVSDGVNTVERFFTIVVTDRNEAPTAVTLDTTEAYDSAPVGSVIGRLAATDVDAQQPHTFAIVASSDPGLFTIVDDELRWARSPLGIDGDRTVTVRVSDSWGGTTHSLQKQFTVTVRPDTRLTVTLDHDAVNENSPAGTPVGNLTATGAGTGPWTYALVPGAVQNVDFTLVGHGLRTARTFDHERTPTATVRVVATDADGRRWQRDLTVRVADVNEAPVLNSWVPIRQENSASAGIWPTFTDPEGDPVTLAFATCAGRTDENDRFTLADGGFRRLVPLDFEDPTNNTLRLCVAASDGSLTTTHFFDEKAIDVNESTTDLTLAPSVVDVEAPVGTVVGTLTAVDPDARKPDLSIVGGSGDFEVVGDELRVARDLGALPLGPVTVRVRAADSWTASHLSAVAQSFEKDLTIRVTRPLALTAPDGSVDENEPAGVVVSTLSATGGEEPYTYALDGSGDDNALFEVVGAQLRTRRALDHEGDGATLTARVKVTDAHDDVVTRTVTVTVTDVNEAPLAVSVTGGSVAENQPAGTAVASFEVTDPDDGDTHTFTLVPGFGDDHNGLFTVSGNRLVTNGVLDHETQGTLTARLRTTDTGGLHRTFTVAVTVTDVAEAPTGFSPATLEVEERRPAGTVVGTVAVLDEDAGESHTLTVLGGAPFEFVGRQLRTTAELDFDDRTSWTVDVRVTDKDDLSVVVELTVTVIDRTFSPVPQPDTLGGVVGNTRATSTTSVLANDQDPEGGTLTVTAGALTTARGGTVTIAGDGSYRYDPPVGVKNVTDHVDYEVTSSASGLTATGRVDLTITDRLVWYVTPGQQGNGTSHAPLGAVTSLAAAVTSDLDTPGDEFFLADGLHGPLQLEAGQKVYGAQRGLPGLVAAAPGAVAKVRTSTSEPALGLAEGALVDGVLLETTGTGPALSASGVNAARVTAQSRIEGTVGSAVVVTGGTSRVSAILVEAGVRAQGGSAVVVTNRQAATRFSGLVESSSTAPGQRAVLLATPGTVDFAGGLQVSSTGAAFTSTGLGAVSVTGTGNWLSSTGAAALELSGTEISADGITVQRLASGGTGRGVSLVDTGAGVLTVTGGPGVARSTVKGIRLHFTRGALLTDVDVTGVGADMPAVDVHTLAGELRLTNTTVTGAGTDGIAVSRTTAPVTVRGSTVSGSGDSGIVVTTSEGTVAVTVEDSTVSGSGASGSARDGLRVESLGSAQVTTAVTGSTLRDNRGDQVQVVSRGSGTTRATITGNVLARSGATGAGQGIVVNAGGSTWTGRAVFDVANNQVRGVDGAGIVVSTNAPERATVGLLEGRVHANVFGAGGCAGTPAVLVDAEGGATLTAAVTGNSGVVCGAPLRASGARGGSVLNLTAENNAWTGAAEASRVTTGTTDVAAGRTCLDLRTTSGDLTFTARGGQLTLPGHVGAWTAPDVTAYLIARNPGGTVTVPTFVATQVVAPACPQPTA